jgi:rare lipoprotein A
MSAIRVTPALAVIAGALGLILSGMHWLPSPRGDVVMRASPAPRSVHCLVAPAIDRSGSPCVGVASFYADWFAGRKMADGTRMRPQGDNAASRTLPLGTTAKVTNLETGQSAIVRIRDRGPYVAGRILDLSPATARQIGLEVRQGVTKVEVAPLAVPLPDGTIKLVANR